MSGKKSKGSSSAQARSPSTKWPQQGLCRWAAGEKGEPRRTCPGSSETKGQHGTWAGPSSLWTVQNVGLTPHFLEAEVGLLSVMGRGGIRAKTQLRRK